PPGQRCNPRAQRLRRPSCLAEVPLALLRPGRAVGLHHQPRYPVERGFEGTVLAFASRLRRRVQGGAHRADGTHDARQRVLGELTELAGERRGRGPRRGGGRLSRRRRRGRRGGRGSGGRGAARGRRRRGGRGPRSGRGRLSRRRRRGGRGGRGSGGRGGARGGGGGRRTRPVVDEQVVRAVRVAGDEVGRRAVERDQEAVGREGGPCTGIVSLGPAGGDAHALGRTRLPVVHEHVGRAVRVAGDQVGRRAVEGDEATRGREDGACIEAVALAPA